MARVNKKVTLNPGVPIQVSPQFTTVREILIQMLHSGTGIGYIMVGQFAAAPSKSASGQLTAELAPATSTAPGGAYTDTNCDISQIWIDGDQADPVNISYDTFVQPGV